MDRVERTRLKQLANDAVIATFGYETREQRLAVALEGCVEELDFIGDECEHCRTCPAHGDHTDETLPVDADEVLRIHGELRQQVATLKDYHVKLVAGLAGTGIQDDSLADKLVEIIEEAEELVNELEAEVLP